MRNALRTLVLVIASVVCATGARAGTTAVVGARIHPISAPPIETGILVFDGDRIIAVGSAEDTDVPPGAEVIHALGLDLWPGMINARTSLGLVEIGSVRGTRDITESGPMNPGARAETAINPESELFPVTRANGVLLAATLPGGRLVPGTVAVIATDGWTPEEMVRRAPAGLVIQWPNMRSKPPEKKKPDYGERPKTAATWEKQIMSLTDMIDEARAYVRACAESETPERDYDVQWEALRPVLTGKVPVWVVATREAQIRAALAWTAEHNLSMVLVDNGDAWRCAEELAQRDVPVITRTIRLPRRRHDPYDTPFVAPARLHNAGVRICFGTQSSSNARNLPQEAARAAAWGLPREIAERGLTLGAAEVLGVSDRYGSLEPGKSATFILVEGDLLETRMQVRRAWIDGVERSLESRHTRLAEKYRSRPRP